MNIKLPTAIHPNNQKKALLVYTLAHILGLQTEGNKYIDIVIEKQQLPIYVDLAHFNFKGTIKSLLLIKKHKNNLNSFPVQKKNYIDFGPILLVNEMNNIHFVEKREWLKQRGS